MAASGGTNADDITDALRDLPVVIEKENTTATWHRGDQVLQAHPDLIVSHLSALVDERVAHGQEAVQEHAFSVPGDRKATPRTDTAHALRERVAAIIGPADGTP